MDTNAFNMTDLTLAAEFRIEIANFLLLPHELCNIKYALAVNDLLIFFKIC